MMGLLEAKSWDFAIKEFERINAILDIKALRQKVSSAESHT